MTPSVQNSTINYGNDLESSIQAQESNSVTYKINQLVSSAKEYCFPQNNEVIEASFEKIDAPSQPKIKQISTLKKVTTCALLLLACASPKALVIGMAVGVILNGPFGEEVNRIKAVWSRQHILIKALIGTAVITGSFTVGLLAIAYFPWSAITVSQYAMAGSFGLGGYIGSNLI